eukprot:361961-Chlamydomonas_euryale.AAC.7
MNCHAHLRQVRSAVIKWGRRAVDAEPRHALKHRLHRIVIAHALRTGEGGGEVWDNWSGTSSVACTQYRRVWPTAQHG